MKSILTWILSFTLVFVAADTMADKWWYFAGDNEPLYGTWVNMDYYNRPAQKIIYHSDGTGTFYTQADSNKPAFKSKNLITGKWKDAEGNIMYKTHWVGNWREEGYSLIKISNSESTLEFLWNIRDYPNKIDPNHVYYRKYTRK